MTKNSVSTRLLSKVAALESKIAQLTQELNQARQHLQNYNAHKEVIESILSLGETTAVEKPRRKYTKRIKTA